MRRMTKGIGVLVGMVLLAGCTQGSDGDGQPAYEEPPTAADASTQAEPITVTRELLGVDIEVSVQPVEIEDGLAALTVDYAVSEDQADEFGSRVNNLRAVLDSTARVDIQATGLRLVDTAAGQVYPVATDADGSWTSHYAVDREASGFAARSISLHAAPSADVVDLLFPSLGAVLDVPVTDAGEQFSAAQDALAAPVDPTGYDLRTYTASHDELSSVEAGETRSPWR